MVNKEVNTSSIHVYWLSFLPPASLKGIILLKLIVITTCHWVYSIYRYNNMHNNSGKQGQLGEEIGMLSYISLELS